MRFLIILLWSSLCSGQELADRSQSSKTLIWQPDRTKKTPEWVISREASSVGPANREKIGKKNSESVGQKDPKLKGPASTAK